MTSGTSAVGSGTVTFKDSGVAFSGAIPLGPTGQVSFSTSNLVAATHTITAEYSDTAGNFSPSTSTGSLTQTVNAQPTSITLTSSSLSSLVGQSVTFTATVTANGTPVTVGGVNFTDSFNGVSNTPVGGDGTDANGQARFTTSALAAGTHSITATYIDALGGFASSSISLNQVVNKANTTTTLTSSANPSFVNQSVTLTAHVAALGSVITVGTVMFKDAGVTLGGPTGLNANGDATFTTTTLSSGSHALTAEYSGSSNFNASTGSLTQTVNLANTSTAVVSTANPSVAGQLVTFTATVTSGATPATIGTVTFKDGGVVLGSPIIVSVGGQAVFATSNLGVGSHTITAEYSGSASFNASTGLLTQVVNRATTSTSLTSTANPAIFGQSVTFTATVTSGGSAVTSGTVTFKDGITALSGALALNSSGQATFTTSSLGVGAHVISAEYSGTATFTASTATASQSINDNVAVQVGDELFVSSFTDGTITRIDLSTLSQRVIVSGLAAPEGGVCRAPNTLYFAETQSGRIRSFNRDGSALTTVLSSSTLRPEGLSFDSVGNLYFDIASDVATGRPSSGAVWNIPGAIPGGAPVQSTAVFQTFNGEGTTFTPNGDLLAVGALPGTGSRLVRFSPPFSPANAGQVVASGGFDGVGVATDAAGNMFVAQGTNGTVRKYSPDGVPIGVVASGLSNAAYLAFDSAGNLYVTDFTSGAPSPQTERIIRVTPSGTQTVFATLRGALGIAICKKPQDAMLFAGGRRTNLVYRYNVTDSGADVSATTSITLPGPTPMFETPPEPAIGPGGELFAIDTLSNAISRFTNPTTATPGFNSTVTSSLFAAPTIGQFSGNALFVAQQAGDSVVEVLLDGARTASVIGVVTPDITPPVGPQGGPGPRGAILTPWNELFVTYCCGINHIQRYTFDGAGHPMPNGMIAGNGLDNPHQMAFSAWGELFVGNPGSGNASFTAPPGTGSVSRFTFDADHNAIANGTITSPTLVGAFGVAFSPWGELFVGNIFGSGVSRFVFDTNHVATPNGSFSTPSAIGALAFATVPVGSSLNVIKTGSGSGTVTSTPAGIACGPTCVQSFAPGSVVTLQATPDTKNFFAGWGGACHGTGGCTVTIGTGSTTVTAIFTPQLTVTRTGNSTGAVTGGAINCGVRCTANAPDGLVLTAIAAANSTFVGWSGAGCSGTGTCTPSGSDRTVTATFALKSFSLMVTTTGLGAGTVTGGAVSCSSNGTGVCATTGTYNQVVVLRATPAPGSFFSGWTGACRGKGVCQIHFTSVQSVTAAFTPQVMVTKAGTGSGLVVSVPGGIACGKRCTGKVPDGGVLTATPSLNSTFTGWSGAGCSGTGTCIPSGSNRSVTATFSRK